MIPDAEIYARKLTATLQEFGRFVMLLWLFMCRKHAHCSQVGQQVGDNVSECSEAEAEDIFR